MAGLPSNNVVDGWAPEPELREAPPRRYEARSEEYPDLNQPSKILFLYLGGGILIVGLALLIYGLGHKQHPVIPVLGVIMAVAGALLVAVYPVRLKSHMNRAEQLVSFGVPVIARILSVDNLTGDSTYARAVKYQVVLPGGDMAHRSVNADERLLPSRVPADATALMDMATSDVELYCALPLKAAEKAPVVSRAPAAPSPSYAAPAVAPPPVATVVSEAPVAQPAGGMGAMPTLGGGQMGTIGAPAPVRPAPAAAPEPAPAPETGKPAPAPAEKPAEKPASSSGLPWE